MADLSALPVQLHTVTPQAAVGAVDVGQWSFTSSQACLIAWGTLPGGGDEVGTQRTLSHTRPHSSTIHPHFNVVVAT